MAYFEGRDRLRLRAWFLAGAALPLAIFALNVRALAALPFKGTTIRAVTTGIPLLDAAILTALAAWLGGKAAVAMRTAHYRRVFRAQHGQRE